MRERIAGLSAMAAMIVERLFAHLDSKATYAASAESYRALLEVVTIACQQAWDSSCCRTDTFPA